MKDIINILESHPSFQTISVSALVDLTTNARLKRYDKGEDVYRARTPSDSAYIVINGACESSPPDSENSTYGVGRIFGERGLLDDTPRRHTVKAITKTKLLKIDGKQLRNLLCKNERLTNSLRGIQTTPHLSYDEKTHSFRPSNHHLSIFVNFTDSDLEVSFLKETCHKLHQVSGKSVLMLHLRTANKTANIPEVKQRIQELSNLSGNGDSLPFYQAELQLGNDDRAYSSLVPFFEACSRRFPYIIGIIDHPESSASKLKCLNMSDSVYPVIEQNGVDLYTVKSLMRDANGGSEDKYRPIVLLESGNPIMDMPNVEKQLGLKVRHVIRQHIEDIYVPMSEEQEFERERRYYGQFGRLAREIGSCRIGLALSSGAAKGLAHVGVIQILEENGIEVDAIAGSSIGSYVGACWARGYNGREMEALSMRYNRRAGLLDMIDPSFPPRRGVIRGKKVQRRLRRILENATFDELSYPLRISAVDLATLEPTIFSEGDVASAVAASCSIPGICVPCKRNGHDYIDGGMANPLPIDALQEMGIENIIAVSTIMTAESARKCAVRARHAKRNTMTARILRSLNRHINYFSNGNVFDTLMRSIETAQIRMLEREALNADVLIQPLACNASWHDFTNPQKYIALGRESAKAKLPELKNLIKSKHE